MQYDHQDGSEIFTFCNDNYFALGYSGMCLGYSQRKLYRR